MLAKPNPKLIVFDEKRDPFKKSSAIELRYARSLRQVAREVGRIVRGYIPGLIESSAALNEALKHYADILKPWARVTASSIAQALNQQDYKTWQRQANEMSRVMREELENAPVGNELQRFLTDNVDLITSLPTDAGMRVHKLTQEGLADSTRASEIAKEIWNTGEVTESRANLIARTEVARTASALTEIRSESVGSEAYIWRTAKDADVRESHRRMEGKVIRWDTPPTLSDGTVTHAGQIYNCRCYPEPIIPDL